MNGIQSDSISRTQFYRKSSIPKRKTKSKGKSLNKTKKLAKNIHNIPSPSRDSQPKIKKQRTVTASDFTKVETISQTTLARKIREGDIEIIKSSLASSIEKDKLLLTAASSGQLEVVKFLLESRANVEIRSMHKDTPLLNATWSGHTAIMKTLLQYRANVNTANAIGTTPLHAAATAGPLSSVKLLLELGAKLDVIDRDGDSPINYASLGNKPDIIKFLHQYKKQTGY